jgi:hypothetical protein
MWRGAAGFDLLDPEVHADDAGTLSIILLNACGGGGCYQCRRVVTCCALTHAIYYSAS